VLPRRAGSLLHYQGVPFAEIGRMVGQRKLASRRTPRRTSWLTGARPTTPPCWRLARPEVAGKGHRCGPAKDTSLISILLALRRVGRAVIAVWRDPDTKALPFVADALVLTGTIFYWRYEDWTFVQSLYFSVVTLTIVGYGDLTPTSDVARIHDHLHPHWAGRSRCLAQCARAAIRQADGRACPEAREPHSAPPRLIRRRGRIAVEQSAQP
jgi:hypothetical protein